MIHSPEAKSTIVGYLELDNIGICELRIYDEDGDAEPHFHIISIDDNSFDCPVCIFEAMYYHKDEHDNGVMLTKTQAKQLNDFMRSNPADSPQPEVIYVGKI